MKTLLRIDASIRLTGSFSRTLGDTFVQAWQQRNPDGLCIKRDLNTPILPHLSDRVARAFFAGERSAEALMLSNTLCDELRQASEILVTCPMYNMGIPSTLKAWLDQVIRARETFRFDPATGYEGMMTGKRAHVIIAIGSGREGYTPVAALEAYIIGALAFIGITDVTVTVIDNTATRDFAGDWVGDFTEKVAESVRAEI